MFTWIHADHLSSATRLTDAAGLEVRRLAYAAFGEEAQNQGSGGDPKYTYTSKKQDSSGLYYYGARYYDPALSRFISADTVYDAGPQGLNRYSYVLNNPILYRDPTGHYINGPDDNPDPTGYGCVTGSQSQFADGTATVHDGGTGAFNLPLSEFDAGGYTVFPADPRIYKSPYPKYEDNDKGLFVIHIGISILWEPYDWGNTFYNWSQGDFSWWDLAGLAPILSAGMIRHGRKLVKGTEEGAELLRIRANKLNKLIPGDSTTAVSKVYNHTTDEIETLVTTSRKKMPKELTGKLRSGERYVSGSGHAEKTLLDYVHQKQRRFFFFEAEPRKIIEGGTSTNICPKCEGLLKKDELTLSEKFKIKKGTKSTPYRRYWRE